MDVFSSLDQPGASTQPYLFDISLLDRRAQPLYPRPHYQPIECMIFDRRPWICFYGGSPPTTVAETDDCGTPCTTAKVAAAYKDGLCSSCRISCAYLQTRLQAQSPKRRPTIQPRSLPGDFIRERFPSPSQLSPSFRKVLASWMRWIHNPRSADPPSRPPTVQIGRDMQPLDLPGRKGAVISFPEQAWVLEQPRLPTRVGSKPLRGCLCLPAMVLPESYQVGPAFARAYYWEMIIKCIASCRVPRSLFAPSTVHVEGPCTQTARTR